MARLINLGRVRGEDATLNGVTNATLESSDGSINISTDTESGKIDMKVSGKTSDEITADFTERLLNLSDSIYESINYIRDDIGVLQEKDGYIEDDIDEINKTIGDEEDSADETTLYGRLAALKEDSEGLFIITDNHETVSSPILGKIYIEPIAGTDSYEMFTYKEYDDSNAEGYVLAGEYEFGTNNSEYNAAVTAANKNYPFDYKGFSITPRDASTANGIKLRPGDDTYIKFKMFKPNMKVDIKYDDNALIFRAEDGSISPITFSKENADGLTYYTVSATLKRDTVYVIEGGTTNNNTTVNSIRITESTNSNGYWISLGVGGDLIGSPSDPANDNGSLYARVAYLINNINFANETRLYWFKEETESAISRLEDDVSSLNRYADDLEEDIYSLETAVGSSTDAANANGSLYARIAAVKNTADNAATKSSVDALTTRVSSNESNISDIFSKHIKNFLVNETIDYTFTTVYAHTYQPETPNYGGTYATLTISPAISYDYFTDVISNQGLIINGIDIGSKTSGMKHEEYNPSIHDEQDCLSLSWAASGGDVKIITENGMVRYIYLARGGAATDESVRFVLGETYSERYNDITNIEHQLVTETDAGFMSPTDKQTLNTVGSPDDTASATGTTIWSRLKALEAKLS